MLYDYPKYYEAAFSFRDIPEEAAFIKTVIDHYSVVPITTVLEIACGHGPHVGELVQRGYKYIGLDKKQTMLDYAATKWRDLEPQPLLVKGEMVDFDLPQKVEFAYVMLGSLYLNSPEQMESHFRAMARCLVPGGLYFLDWCIQFDDPMARKATNSVELEYNGLKIRSQFDIRLIDIGRQLYEEVWTVDVEDDGEFRRLEMIERNRAVFPQEFLLFVADRTDFQFVGWWYEWDLNSPIIGSEQPTRPLVLLRRK